jgi:hypothetical protein
MPCYHPLKAWKTQEGGITFNEKNAFSLPLKLPCGQCIGCRLERSRQWAVRCMHEASLHEKNSFITLTYDNDHIPFTKNVNLDTGQLMPVPTLRPRDITLFLKRLRKRYGKMRFFQCGEYGEKLGRPHHHMLCFGLDFPDKEFYSERKGQKYYRSPELEKVWGQGMVIIGDVTFESAAYVARYITKKVIGSDDRKWEHYGQKQEEYITMSRRPGIAREWFEKYKDDVYPHDYVIVRNGVKCKPPKYYDKLFELTDPFEMDYIKMEREERARAHSSETTPERLKVREELQISRAGKLKRGYEND